jgi:hypothetical protein
MPTGRSTGGADLVCEPPSEDVVGGQLGTQDLERHDLASRVPARPHHDPHGSLAERALYLVRTEPVARAETPDVTRVSHRFGGRSDGLVGRSWPSDEAESALPLIGLAQPRFEERARVPVPISEERGFLGGARRALPNSARDLLDPQAELARSHCDLARVELMLPELELL